MAGAMEVFLKLDDDDITCVLKDSPNNFPLESSSASDRTSETADEGIEITEDGSEAECVTLKETPRCDVEANAADEHVSATTPEFILPSVDDIPDNFDDDFDDITEMLAHTSMPVLEDDTTASSVSTKCVASSSHITVKPVSPRPTSPDTCAAARISKAPSISDSLGSQAEDKKKTKNPLTAIKSAYKHVKEQSHELSAHRAATHAQHQAALRQGKLPRDSLFTKFRKSIRRFRSSSTPPPTADIEEVTEISVRVSTNSDTSDDVSSRNRSRDPGRPADSSNHRRSRSIIHRRSRIIEEEDEEAPAQKIELPPRSSVPSYMKCDAIAAEPRNSVSDIAYQPPYSERLARRQVSVAVSVHSNASLSSCHPASSQRPVSFTIEDNPSWEQEAEAAFNRTRNWARRSFSSLFVPDTPTPPPTRSRSGEPTMLTETEEFRQVRLNQKARRDAALRRSVQRKSRAEEKAMKRQLEELVQVAIPDELVTESEERAGKKEAARQRFEEEARRYVSELRGDVKFRDAPVRVIRETVTQPFSRNGKTTKSMQDLRGRFAKRMSATQGSMRAAKERLAGKYALGFS